MSGSRLPRHTGFLSAHATMLSQKARQHTATMTMAQIAPGDAVVLAASIIAGPLASTTRHELPTHPTAISTPAAAAAPADPGARRRASGIVTLAG